MAPGVARAPGRDGGSRPPDGVGTCDGLGRRTAPAGPGRAAVERDAGRCRGRARRRRSNRAAAGPAGGRGGDSAPAALLADRGQPAPTGCAGRRRIDPARSDGAVRAGGGPVRRQRRRRWAPDRRRARPVVGAGAGGRRAGGVGAPWRGRPRSGAEASLGGASSGAAGAGVGTPGRGPGGGSAAGRGRRGHRDRRVGGATRPPGGRGRRPGAGRPGRAAVRLLGGVPAERGMPRPDRRRRAGGRGRADRGRDAAGSARSRPGGARGPRAVAGPARLAGRPLRADPAVARAAPWPAGRAPPPWPRWAACECRWCPDAARCPGTAGVPRRACRPPPWRPGRPCGAGSPPAATRPRSPFARIGLRDRARGRRSVPRLRAHRRRRAVGEGAHRTAPRRVRHVTAGSTPASSPGPAGPSAHGCGGG